MTDEPIALPFGDGPGGRPITMRGPADMAEALPYLLGFFPDDSIVAVGLQPPGLHQGGVIRLDIPESAEEWPAAAEETAALLVRLSERQDRRPVQVLLYLCQDPAGPQPGGEYGPPVAERLRPLAERLQQAFESRGVRVKESLCVSADRWWSFLCTREGCCDPAGHPIHRTPGPGPVAVAATVAGLAPRGSRKEILAALAPLGPPGADAVRGALARAGAGPSPGRRLSLDRREHAALLDAAVAEFMAGATELDEERTARLLLALQDRIVRDRAAEYARPDELASAQRLWRFLATRCVAPYESCAAPPLTLLAWTSWVAGDTATARVVLGHTLRRHPSYLLAQLLYESLNSGFSPDTLLTSVETERRRRTEREAREEQQRAVEQAAGDRAPEADPDPEGDPERESGPSSGPSPAPAPAAEGPAPGKVRRRGRRRRGRPAVAGTEGAAGTAEAASDGPAGPGRPAGVPPGREGTGGDPSGGRGTGTATARARCAAVGVRPGAAPAPGCRAQDRRSALRTARFARPIPRPVPCPSSAAVGGCRRGCFRGVCGEGAERRGR
ncbi:DUF4192 domain-containing protein [Kitasatospora sp. NPDC058032]|uniref:DUF4192 domain-containing protein n=1 Tax=Kitasatospora sp. NPDC058032 TaxID=3346307 RepID=UPI0036D8F4C6